MDKKLINQSVFSQASLRNKIFNLLSSTKKRQQDIVIRRFGLNGKNPETLDSIGKSYGITRERVRQIQEVAMSKIDDGVQKYQSVNKYYCLEPYMFCVENSKL